jgi:spore germination cell wall hydrolase CwlJ-like protein
MNKIKLIFITLISTIIYVIVTHNVKPIMVEKDISIPYQAPKDFQPYYISNDYSINYTKDDIDCLQANIFFEARNQSDDGKRAVAEVTLNRVTNKKFPNTVCDVVTAGKYTNGKIKRNACAFSWYCDGLSDRPKLSNKLELKKWNKSREIALNALKRGVKHNSNATHYHSLKVKPYWIKSEKMTKLFQVGDHIFYKENA